MEVNKPQTIDNFTFLLSSMELLKGKMYNAFYQRILDTIAYDPNQAPMKATVSTFAPDTHRYLKYSCLSFRIVPEEDCEPSLTTTS